MEWSVICSVVSNSVTPWTVPCQAPLFIGFFRQKYWSEKPFLSPADLPNPGVKSGSPGLQADSLTIWATRMKWKRKYHSTHSLGTANQHQGRGTSEIFKMERHTFRLTIIDYSSRWADFEVKGSETGSKRLRGAVIHAEEWRYLIPGQLQWG